MTTLNLWVSNQESDSDTTADYIRATRFVPATGVAYDSDGCTLTGDDAEVVFAEFRRLAEMVAAGTHGETADGDPIPGTPALTACPEEMIEGEYRSAGETLARRTCREHSTYAALAKVLA